MTAHAPDDAPREPITSWRRRRFRDALYALLAVGVPVPVIASVVGSALQGRTITDEIFSYSDDAFYYFEIASRWADGQGSTFDGLQATNGYQPLWFWVNAAVFTVASRPAAVVTIVGIAALLWLAAVAMTRAIAERLSAPWAGVAALSIVAVATYRAWFSGMEFALVATIVTAIVWWALRTEVITTRSPRTRDCLVLGILLALAVLARFDLAALVLVLVAALMIAERSASLGSRARSLGLVLGPVLAALLCYAALGLLWFGSMVPISGRAKQLGPFSPHLGYVFKYLAQSFGGWVPYVGTMTLILVAVTVILLWRRPAVVLRTTTLTLLVALVMAQGLAFCYYLAASSWGFEIWYFGLVPPTLLLSLIALGSFITVPLSRQSTARGAVLVVALASVVGVVAEVAARPPEYPSTERPIVATVEMANWVNRSLPTDARLAMGDWGGAFGFAAERTVMQTEGLVGSAEYLRALEDGRAGRFLADAGVTYFVKIGDLRRTGTTPGCSVVREPVYGEGPTMSIRVCAADLLHMVPGPDVEGDVRNLACHTRFVRRELTTVPGPVDAAAPRSDRANSGRSVSPQRWSASQPTGGALWGRRALLLGRLTRAVDPHLNALCARRRADDGLHDETNALADRRPRDQWESARADPTPSATGPFMEAPPRGARVRARRADSGGVGLGNLAVFPGVPAAVGAAGGHLPDLGCSSSTR